MNYLNNLFSNPHKPLLIHTKRPLSVIQLVQYITAHTSADSQLARMFPTCVRRNNSPETLGGKVQKTLDCKHTNRCYDEAAVITTTLPNAEYVLCPCAHML